MSAHEIWPVALHAVSRIDTLLEIERGISGLPAQTRLEARQSLSRPLVKPLHDWLLLERARLSCHAPAAKAIAYMLEKDRWPAFSRLLEDGCVCLIDNAAERALRGVALGRKAWLFAGSDRGGLRAAFFYSLIITAKLSNIDPQAWLADVPARMPSLPMSHMPELLPGNWSTTSDRQNAP